MAESKQELKERIGDLAYRVTQEAATERPFTGTYNDFFEEGLYVDIVSGEALFSSKDKFRSGCGWPAFSQPITADKISRHDDYSYLNIPRVEVKSQQAQSHLGHVFLDGPKDRGGLRYCINSAALDFIPKDQLVQRGYGDYLELFEEDK